MLNKIHTYIINLEKRVDRKNHILNEFTNKSEFEIILTKAITDSNPAVGLYKSLYNVVSEAKKKRLPYVLFCEDDHQFTESFNPVNLKKQISIAESLSADLLLGGVIWFDYGTKNSSELMWINHFTGTQFSIIYSKFYNTILNSEFNSTDVIDEWMARLSHNKFLINPMISIQKFFGYSDVTNNNNKEGLLSNLTLNTINRLDTLVQINNHVSKIKNIDNEMMGINGDFQIATYLINPNNNNKILSQFVNKSEFLIHENYCDITCNNEIDLFEVIKESIRSAIAKNEEIIVICNDTHVFSQEYNKNIFFKNIMNASVLGADFISGGNKSINQVVVVNENLCWFDLMESFEFLIIYEKFYNQILNTQLTEEESICAKLSTITANKYLFYPYISKFNENTKHEYIDDRKYYKKKNQKYNICKLVMDVIYDNTLV